MLASEETDTPLIARSMGMGPTQRCYVTESTSVEQQERHSKKMTLDQCHRDCHQCIKAQENLTQDLWVQAQSIGIASPAIAPRRHAELGRTQEGCLAAQQCLDDGSGVVQRNTSTQQN